MSILPLFYVSTSPAIHCYTLHIELYKVANQLHYKLLIALNIHEYFSYFVNTHVDSDQASTHLMKVFLFHK